MTKPYRPMPSDFRNTYIRLGWDGIRDHYRTNDRCIARWIEECGGDELRRERAQVSGGRMRPDLRSHRYRAAGDRIGALGDDRTPRLPRAGTWLKAFDGAYRLLLTSPQITEMEERFARQDRHGTKYLKSFQRIHAELCGGWNDLEDHPFPVATNIRPTATLAECVEAVRLALIGGGMAVVDGELIAIDAARAERILQDHLLDRPIEHARRLASTIVAWTIMGPPTPTTTSIGEFA